jgi:hypothetical protein
VTSAELVAEGWLLPGLVDAHTHPGAEAPGKPLDEALLREILRQHLAAGVTMIRAPGLAVDPPAWFGRDGDVPRAVHAGPWIAQHGQFFDGWGAATAQAPPRSLLAGEPLPGRLLGHAERLPDAGPADAPVPQDGHPLTHGGIDLRNHRLNPGQAGQQLAVRPFVP